MRLNRFLASSGVTSRRGADELIAQGRVSLNGQTVTKLGSTVEVGKDVIKLDGKTVTQADHRVVYILNKPLGVVTTADDPEHRPTVLEFVPRSPRVFPCGRLDVNTQGLVVLTNDGELCYQLTHPKFVHQKEYVVHGQTANPAEALEHLKNGIKLIDGFVKPDGLIVRSIHHRSLIFSLTIHEGRNHIVRRLCAAVNIEIQSLTRIRMGKYSLGDLTPGQWRVVES